MGTLAVDLFVRHGSNIGALELKYKTRRVGVPQDHESFILKDQGAQPLGRYDVLKDVQRLESVLKDREATWAAAVFLTNDSAYWTGPRNRRDTSANFNLADDRVITGELAWSDSAAPGTRKGREKPIQLTNRYHLSWREYSKVSGSRYGTFRTLSIEIPG